MPRPRLRRALRASLYTLATITLLYATVIAGPMLLTRIRMTHLLADFQSIRPTQSTWADAQLLMTRWGKFGHDKGTCTAQSCEYRIVLMDPWDRLLVPSSESPYEYIDSYPFRIPVFSGYFGLRGARYFVTLRVKNGSVIETQSGLGLQGSLLTNSDEAFPESIILMLGTQVRSRLRRSFRLPLQNDKFIIGDDDQLADHPDYKIGRPQNCHPCIDGEVTCTPALAHSEIIRLSSYDFSCVTRWHPCTQLRDILPAARSWFQHGNNDSEPLPSAPSTCKTSPSARGRDAEIILEIGAKSATNVRMDFPGVPSYVDEITTARLMRVIKGKFDLKLDSKVTFHPVDTSTGSAVAYLPQHLLPGMEYFILMDTNYHNENGPFEIPRCGVLEATPENLRRLSLGIAEDLKYRDIDNPDN